MLGGGGKKTQLRERVIGLCKRAELRRLAMDEAPLEEGKAQVLELMIMAKQNRELR